TGSPAVCNRRKPKGLPYAGGLDVGQGFPDPLFPTTGSPAVCNRRKPKGLPYAGGLDVGQGFPDPLFPTTGSPANTEYKKRIRLKEFSYKGPHRYFVTLCTYNKENVFYGKYSVSCLLDSLRAKSRTFRFKVWAYCFMPDHLHLLVEGSDDSSNFRKFISSFKQDTGFSYKKRSGLRLWQTNYYEHVLRNEEYTDAVAKYIFNNPVRKGLVEDYRKYALLGSFEFDVSQT
ncbi:transposase, partial [candidate division WOR-3 bacterium]|nr:transposase [candidate division WOR-3 bacterium]